MLFVISSVQIQGFGQNEVVSIAVHHVVQLVCTEHTASGNIVNDFRASTWHSTAHYLTWKLI